MSKKESNKIESVMKLCNTSGIKPWFVAKISGSPGVFYGAFHSEGISIYKFDKAQPALTQTHVWENFTEATVDFFAAKTAIILSGESHTTTLVVMEKGKDLVPLLRSNTGLKILILDRLWWRKILGFRSNTKWKMVIAIVVYIILAGKVVGAFNGNDSTVPPAPTAPAVTASSPAKTPEQIAREKADAAKISTSDKELLKKSYSSFDAQQLVQFAEIKEKYKNLPNAEVTGISADFARISTEEAVEVKKQAEVKAAADAKAAYQAWVKDQFSAWDGTNSYLVDLVKRNLNDPKSFEHVETTYADKGDYLLVKMTYRAKNAFGGLILQNVTAKSDYKTDTISIISQND